MEVEHRHPGDTCRLREIGVEGEQRITVLQAGPAELLVDLLDVRIGVGDDVKVDDRLATQGLERLDPASTAITPYRVAEVRQPVQLVEDRLHDDQLAVQEASAYDVDDPPVDRDGGVE